MNRRAFMTLLAGVAAMLPLAAHAQPAGRTWRIGMLDTASRELNRVNLTAFLKGMREFGYVEGQNLLIDYRSAEGRNEGLPALVSELLQLRPDLIVVRGTPEATAVKNATTTIPVVLAAIADPIGSGFVAELARPGGNFTGLSSFITELEAKRVELLREMVPELKRMATLRNFSNPAVQSQWEELQAAGRFLAIEVDRLDVRSAVDLGPAFDMAVKQRVEALVIGIDGVTRANQKLLVDLAARYKLPAIYPSREFVEDGGLMAYGVNYPQLYYRAAAFVDKILKGAKPADLPVEQPTKMELIVNLKTAKSLGRDTPTSLLLRADEVIE
jgi:putative ABC transport system substrate-binding protein